MLLHIINCWSIHITRYIFVNKYYFSKIHEALGFDQIRNGVILPGLHTVSAPMKIETLLYLQSLDMVIHDSFGSTECSAVISNMTGIYVSFDVYMS